MNDRVASNYCADLLRVTLCGILPGDAIFRFNEREYMPNDIFPQIRI